MLTAAIALVSILLYLIISNRLSYGFLKKRILCSHRWDLNICCGTTDGGGINADIHKHADLPNFRQISNIYSLPFRDGEFRRVLCSHTIEHVEEPARFYGELKRVGREVLLVVPPLWDLSASFNILEHRWLFLTFRKRHSTLPRFLRLPLAAAIQRRFGQRLRA